MPELIEAAIRTGDRALAAETQQQLTARATASGTEWALRLAARSYALAVRDEGADDLYIEAIGHLTHARVAVDLARRAPPLGRVAPTSEPSGGRS